LLKIFLISSIATLSMASYTNCDLKNDNYEDICKKVVKKGVSYDYANRFLLSPSKVKKMDEKSYSYMQPKMIKKHRKSEKKANNILVKHVPSITKHLNDYKEVYDYTEKKYSVNREVIAAILLKETRLGIVKPSHDAFEVFNTLVLKVTPKTSRDKWLIKLGKTNMVSIITHCYENGIEPKKCNLPSSYAGAIGIPQFMPNSFKYAEGYKSKYADLTKMEDAIVSASKFLNKKAKYTTLIDWRDMPNIEEEEGKWYQFEFTNENASFVYDMSKRTGKKYSCFACGKPKLGLMKEYTRKIMTYNNSSNYAVGVLSLAYRANKMLKDGK